MASGNEEDIHNASFNTHGTISNPGTPHVPRKHKKSNVYLADIAASSILDELTSVKAESQLFLNHDLNRQRYNQSSNVPNAEQTKRINEMQQSIVQSTDKAQLIAATSMAIIQVALLKDTLDAGPEGSSYYGVLLGFIIAALVLQVFIGLLAMFISFLKSRVNDTSHTKLCSWIPCFQRRQKGPKIDLDSWLDDQNDKYNQEDEIDNGRRYKCPWGCAKKEDAYDVSDVYRSWKDSSIQAQMRCADIDEEMRLLTETVNKARKELQDLEAMEDEGSVFELRLNDIKERLNQAEDARLKMEQRRFKANRLKSQGEVLRKHVELIHKERTLRHITIWQNVVNILLYIVFVLNAIIAGFGLSNKKQ